MRRFEWAVRDLPADGGGNRRAVVPNVDDVRTALAALLPAADVHRRRADERPLPDERARVADQAGGAAHQAQERLHREVLVEPDVVRLAPLAELPHAAGDVFRAG